MRRPPGGQAAPASGICRPPGGRFGSASTTTKPTLPDARPAPGVTSFPVENGSLPLRSTSLRPLGRAPAPPTLHTESRCSLWLESWFRRQTLTPTLSRRERAPPPSQEIRDLFSTRCEISETSTLAVFNLGSRRRALLVGTPGGGNRWRGDRGGGLTEAQRNWQRRACKKLGQFYVFPPIEARTSPSPSRSAVVGSDR